MLADNKQIDKRITVRNQNRSGALGRPAMKLLGGGGAGGGGGGRQPLQGHWDTTGD